MPHDSSPELLTLHAVRLLGIADAGAVTRRFGIDGLTAGELLLDAAARGWVSNVDLMGIRGWTLTAAGRQENEGMLHAELELTGTRALLESALERFSQLNSRFLGAVTRWQMRPTRSDPLAANDHSDWAWDESVLDGLRSLHRQVTPIGDELAAALTRFDGYHERFGASLRKVDRGGQRWVDEPGIDSCHAVWFQLHEDLLATLGVDRAQT